MREDVRFELINDAIGLMDDADFSFVELAYKTVNYMGDRSRVNVACSILAKYSLSFEDFRFWMVYDPTK